LSTHVLVPYSMSVQHHLRGFALYTIAKSNHRQTAALSGLAFPSSSAARHFIGHFMTLTSSELHIAYNTRTHFHKLLTQQLTLQAWQTNRTSLQSGSHRRPSGGLLLESITASFATTVVPCHTTSRLCYSWSKILGFLGSLTGSY
jgi:hypothetical protein